MTRTQMPAVRHSEPRPAGVLVLAIAVIFAAACENAASPTVPTQTGSPERELASIAETANLNATTAASSIAVHQGSIMQTASGATFDLQGTSGFRFEGGAHADVGPTLFFFQQQCPAGCPPGMTLPFQTLWVTNEMFVDARLRGNAYAVGGQDSAAAATIRAAGSLTLPAATAAPTASVTAPFTLTGEFLIPDRFDLTGHGVATFHLQWNAVDHAWYVQHVEMHLRPGGGLRFEP